MGISNNGGTAIAGGFISRKNPTKNGRFGGTTISGNHEMEVYSWETLGNRLEMVVVHCHDWNLEGMNQNCHLLCLVVLACCSISITQLSIGTHRIAWCYLFNSVQILLIILTGCQPSHNHTCFMPKNMSFGCQGDLCKITWICPTWLSSIFNDSSVRFIPWGDLSNAVLFIAQLIMLIDMGVSINGYPQNGWFISKIPLKWMI